MANITYFTSESVTEGHPDKLCDQISDGILDALLADDPQSRVACECICTTGMVTIVGEITTECYADIPGIARNIIEDVGYTDSAMGFDARTCAVLTSLDEQSADIAIGVNNALEGRALAAGDIGAGDQGIMFGFACDQTPELMPMPISFAHALTRRLAQVRKESIVPYLRPDGKSQVTIEYHDGRPARVDAVVLSTQHTPEAEQSVIYADMIEHVIKAAIPSHWLDERTRYYINPTGRFVVGGPHGDSGLTGRKIIVDTYGGYSRHGGGCFSGKDPTKVDRSASYAVRHIAKNIVAAGLASACEIQVAYAIGKAQPVSIYIDTFGTGRVPEEQIAKLIQEKVDLRPAAIIERLDLRRPLYRQVAAYGHFGRSDLDLPWEQLDLADCFAR